MDFSFNRQLSSSPSGYYSSSECENLEFSSWEKQMRSAMLKGEPEASTVISDLLQVN